MIASRLIPMLGPRSWTPYSLPNISLIHDVSDLASLDYDGSNRVRLIVDKSANSSVNGLALPGITGNNAETPDNAGLHITADIDIREALEMVDWTPAALSTIMAKRTNAASNLSWRFQISTAGILQLEWSPDGTNVVTAVATQATGLTDGTLSLVRATLDVDNGASAWVVAFYTKACTPATAATAILANTGWTQLGSSVVGGATTTLNAGTTPLCVGSVASGGVGPISGRIYAAAVLNGINGTVAFFANFTAVSKLAATFVESSATGATVTINTSGDSGARICGERDVYQGTSGKKALVDVSTRAITYDGLNDLHKAVSYLAPQPRMRITVASCKAWTSGATLWDGTAAASGKLYQVGSTPQVTLNAGADGPTLSTFALNTPVIFIETLNGASSTLQRNSDAPTSTANAGAGAPNGRVFGADGASANFSNFELREQLEFSVPLDAATLTRVVNYLQRKWQIA